MRFLIYSSKNVLIRLAYKSFYFKISNDLASIDLKSLVMVILYPDEGTSCSCFHEGTSLFVWVKYIKL